MAALITQELGLEPELVEGGRGEFTVWVGDTIVSRKDADFPSDSDALAAVRQALDR